MSNPYQDDYNTCFLTFASMMDYHAELTRESQWRRMPVNSLYVSPLDESSPLYGDKSRFGVQVSQDAIEDTAKHLALAMKVDGAYFPLRETAWKSLLDRAKINGTALPKLGREELANVLNACLALFGSEALLLIRNEKVAAVHSGDARDYSILLIDTLLLELQKGLDERFPGAEFNSGYTDHSMTSASFLLPKQRDDLLATYHATLAAQGKAALAAKLTPGIRFTTSDVGVSSAKISALLLGLQMPIQIGEVIAVEHRWEKTPADFADAMQKAFAKFGDVVAKLEKLAHIPLANPVNAMTAVCKKLSLPKKAAMEAISMFEMTCGPSPTAHDVFMALQEILFLLKAEHTPVAKILSVGESIARALTMRWPDYDLAKAVSY